MYICKCIHICIRIHICLYSHLFIDMYICTCIFLRVHFHAYPSSLSRIPEVNVNNQSMNSWIDSGEFAVFLKICLE